jgi:hypothetical protein
MDGLAMADDEEDVDKDEEGSVTMDTVFENDVVAAEEEDEEEPAADDIPTEDEATDDEVIADDEVVANDVAADEDVAADDNDNVAAKDGDDEEGEDESEDDDDDGLETMEMVTVVDEKDDEETPDVITELEITELEMIDEVECEAIAEDIDEVGMNPVDDGEDTTTDDNKLDWLGSKDEGWTEVDELALVDVDGEEELSPLDDASDNEAELEVAIILDDHELVKIVPRLEVDVDATDNGDLVSDDVERVIELEKTELVLDGLTVDEVETRVFDDSFQEREDAGLEDIRLIVDTVDDDGG